MKIAFTGDLFLGGDLANQDSVIVQSKVFNASDIRIVNLEQPISDRKEVADKSTIFTGSSSIKKLKKLNIKAVNLAHNHIHDKTELGIYDTIAHLRNEGISYFGAGRDLSEAREPYWIYSNLCILSYCDFGRPYLKQVKVAGKNEPGVNPLRYGNIINDLNQLPRDTKAILYFHWGREHVWLPPYHDIELAKQLLVDDRVALIIGMHAHRIQGYIEHNGKRAYMCLGNFLFPNFYIKPVTQIAYPDKTPRKTRITRQYHSVKELTYKKWRRVNRCSLILQYDTKTEKVNHFPLFQDDNEPTVRQVRKFSMVMILFFVFILSQIYKLPKSIYKILEKMNVVIMQFSWRLKIVIFRIRENGFNWLIRKVIMRMGGG